MKLKDIILIEVLNKPYKYRWQSRDEIIWIGTFTSSNTQDYEYMGTVSKEKRSMHGEPIKILTVEFSLDIKSSIRAPDSDYRKMKWGVIKTGDEFRIFATVMEMLKEHIRSIKPDEINFGAEEKSRKKLYASLINRYAPKLGYKLKSIKDNTPVGTEFVLEKIK